MTVKLGSANHWVLTPSSLDDAASGQHRIGGGTGWKREVDMRQPLCYNGRER